MNVVQNPLILITVIQRLVRNAFEDIIYDKHLDEHAALRPAFARHQSSFAVLNISNTRQRHRSAQTLLDDIHQWPQHYHCQPGDADRFRSLPILIPRAASNRRPKKQRQELNWTGRYLEFESVLTRQSARASRDTGSLHTAAFPCNICKVRISSRRRLRIDRTQSRSRWQEWIRNRLMVFRIRWSDWIAHQYVSPRPRVKSTYCSLLQEPAGSFRCRSGRRTVAIAAKSSAGSTHHVANVSGRR